MIEAYGKMKNVTARRCQTLEAHPKNLSDDADPAIFGLIVAGGWSSR